MEHDNKPTGEVFEQTNVVVERPRRDWFLPVSIVVAGVIVAGAVIFASLWKGGTIGGGAVNNNNQGGQAAAAQPAANAADIMKLGANDPVLGNTNAPVTIIEYADYQCPYCTRFFSQTEPLLVANYVNTGKAKLVFRDLAFLGPESVAAAAAAQCANDQGKFWAFHDALYTAKISDENKGGGENDGYFTPALFTQLAQQVGLDVNQFNSCVSSNKYASLVAQEKTDASNAGIVSTPTFYINGNQLMGAQPYSTFQQALDSAAK
jgi:protein-disulfide isomerase